MPAPPAFVYQLLGIRANGTPNIADGSNRKSVEIAEQLLGRLGVDHLATRTGQAEGRFLEEGVRGFLFAELPLIASHRNWVVTRKQQIDTYFQYKHLGDLDDLIRNDDTGTLSTSIGRDYQVRPDVTVGLTVDHDELPMLHASVSCKFTIRSDRVQNIRHEGVILTRHRRGRQPHIVAVTSEPQPSRLAAIARGTGEIDCVYHVALHDLIAATSVAGGPEQQSILEELVTQERLRDLTELPQRLSV